jgi:hypothetical protein
VTITVDNIEFTDEEVEIAVGEDGCVHTLLDAEGVARLCRSYGVGDAGIARIIERIQRRGEE